MTAVARQTPMHGTGTNGTATPREENHDLDDLEAALLQTIIAKRVITLDDALKFLETLADVTESDIQADQDSLEEVVSRINAALADFDLEVRKTLDQSTGNPIWAIVNTTSDAMTQLATAHNASEIAYFRTLLAAIFDTSNTVHEEVFAVKSTDAVNLSSAENVGITKSAGEAALLEFIREGWLEKSRNGFITITERGLLELKEYLMEMFNDMDEEGGGRIDKMRACHACQEIITKGQRCATLRCPIRFHNHCASNFFSPRNNGCPSCKTPWKEHLPVGEAACSDRTRRRVSNRQREGERSESPEESRRSSARASPRSDRSRSPDTRRRGGRGARRTSSRRTSVAQSIQEEEEEEEGEDIDEE